jgi:hypothetical protein
MSVPDPLPTAPPRRKRRLVWYVLLSQVAAWGLLAVGWYIHRSNRAARHLAEAQAEADRVDPGWRLLDLEARRAVLADDENAAVQLLAAHQLLPAKWPAWDYPTDEDSAAGRLRQALQESFKDLDPAVGLNDAQVKALREELAKAAAGLAAARKLKALPRGRYTVTWKTGSAFIGTLTPHLQKIPEVARALEYDALLRAHDNDLDGALASCRAVLNAGRSVGDEQMSISQLVRTTRQRQALAKVERVLAQGEASSAALAATQRLFADEAEQPWLLFALRGERAGMDGVMEEIEAIGQQSGQSWKQLRSLVRAGPEPGAREAAMESLLPGRLKHNRAAALEFLTRYIEILKRPVDEQRPLLAELEEAVDGLPYFARLLVPAVLKLTKSHHRSRAEMRCAAAALAVERFRQERGRWPAAVAELVPQYLPEILNDPFDGQPLRLGRFDQGIVIYSVGPDGEDDSGNLDRRNPLAPGTDLGFRLWDVKHRRQPSRPLPAVDP